MSKRLINATISMIITIAILIFSLIMYPTDNSNYGCAIQPDYFYERAGMIIVNIPFALYTLYNCVMYMIEGEHNETEIEQ